MGNHLINPEALLPLQIVARFKLPGSLLWMDRILHQLGGLSQYSQASTKPEALFTFLKMLVGMYKPCPTIHFEDMHMLIWACHLSSPGWALGALVVLFEEAWLWKGRF